MSCQMRTRAEGGSKNPKISWTSYLYGLKSLFRNLLILILFLPLPSFQAISTINEVWRRGWRGCRTGPPPRRRRRRRRRQAMTGCCRPFCRIFPRRPRPMFLVYHCARYLDTDAPETYFLFCLCSQSIEVMELEIPSSAPET